MKTLLFHLLLLIPAMAMSQPHQPTLYALVVGVSQYEDTKLNTLHYADSDAISFYNFLKKGYVNKFDSNNVKLLLNKDASYKTIYDAFDAWIDSLSSVIMKDDVLYIYWSGHGMVALGDQKLLCHNSKRNNPNNAPLTSAMLMSHIKASIGTLAQQEGVRVYLIIDACREDDVINPLSPEIAARMRRPGGVGEFDLFATQSEGSSFETKNVVPGAGVFTYFLLLGLQGGADTEPPYGVVTFGELESFLQNVKLYVSRYWPGNDQVPELVPYSNPYRKVVMTNLPPDIADKYRKMGEAITRDLHSTTGIPGQKGSLVARGVRFRVPRPFRIPSDSVLYDTILARIRRNELVEPDKFSAYKCYLQLKEEYPRSKCVSRARGKLFPALMDEVRVLIDRYLDGNLDNVSMHTFDLGYTELRTAVDLYPQDSGLAVSLEPQLIFLYARAKAASHKPQDWDEGLQLLNENIARSNKAAYLYQTKGLLNYNKGRYFTARQCFDSAIKYAPDWIYALASSASTNFRIQEFGQSIDTCMKIIKMDPSYSKAYSLLACNFEAIADYRGSGDYHRAIDSNLRALQIDSSNTEGYLNLGRIYSKILVKRNENIRLARSYFTIGAEKYGDPYCLAALGQMQAAQLGDHVDSAIYYFKRALNINPFNVVALYQYARLLDITGSTDKGRALFCDAICKSSGDYNIYAQYSNFLFTAVSPDTSERVFQKLVKINSEDPTVFIDHSRQYENIDSLEKARDVLYEGISFIPASPSLCYGLAEFYFKHHTHPLFNNFALDSSKMYLDYVNSIAPEYSLADYAQYQVGRLRNSDSTDIYLAMANQKNRYVQYTGNFNKQLGEMGDSALSNKRYKEAILYYSLVKDLRKDKFTRRDQFHVNLGISRSYYLLGQQDSALNYAREARRNGHSLDDEGSLSELRALIAFEKRDFRQSRRMFQSADDDRDNPDNLGEALSLWEMNRTIDARDLALIGLDNNPDAFNEMQAKAGIVYSNYFIAEMKKFVGALR